MKPKLGREQLTRSEMESRRLAAVEQLRCGVTPAKVAKLFRVSRTSALRWRDRLKANDDLHKRRGTGRRAKLSLAQKQKVLRVFGSGASTSQLHQFILEEFGIQYDIDHVYRLRVMWGIPRL